MAVAGVPENRVGVVVAKNELAKKYGVKTTDTVYAAKKKCPGIVFVPPRHSFYRQVSEKVNAIYNECTEYPLCLSIFNGAVTLLNFAGGAAQSQRNHCSIWPVLVHWRGGIFNLLLFKY